MSKSTTATPNFDHVGGADDRAVPQDSSPSRAFERRILRYLLKGIGSPAVAIRLWDGQEIRSSARQTVGTVVITSRQTLHRLFTHQDVAFGDEYSAGRLLVEGDLTEVLTEFDSARTDAGEGKVLGKLPRFFNRRVRPNSLEASRANIHHHYDLGNDFYRLWLDQEMQYTCAYFPRPDMTIEDAQQAKLHHVCRKLQLKPGDRVVEAGCGWGSLARHMAKYYGAKVRAFNISREQIQFARERAEREGMADSVEYVLDDYRNISGEYDVFVSVGMLEHVGTAQYPVLGGVIDRCLRSNGRALIHTIGRNQSKLMNAWIEKRIFPGAYPPTLREMMDILEPFNFSVLDVENLRLHYARTLECWLERFNRAEQTIAGMFDERFVRAWRLYLSGSIAAFLASQLQLFQVVFARGRDNSVPWTREHVYVA